MAACRSRGWKIARGLSAWKSAENIVKGLGAHTESHTSLYRKAEQSSLKSLRFCTRSLKMDVQM